MEGGLKKFLLSTSALVGGVLCPVMAFADPVTTTILLSSAVSAGVGAVTAVGLSAGFSAIAYQFATRFVINAVGGFVLNALQPKPRMPNINNLSSTGGGTTQGTSSVGGYQISGVASAAEHQIIYGQTRVGGVIVFKDVTDSNQFLHVVYALAGHECQAIDKVYLNGEELTIDASTNMVTAPSKYAGNVRIKKHLGTDTTGDTDLVSESTKWTSDHKLREVTYIYARYKFVADSFPTGEPNLTALVSGKKVFNPQNSQTAFSSNSALCLRDYLTNTKYGLGVATTDVDDTLFGSAFNVCDDDITLAGGGTQKRYTVNGNFLTSASPRQIIETLTASMAGFLWYAQGKWRCKAGSYTSPVATFTEDDLRDTLAITTRQSRRDNFNVVRGKFSGPETNFQTTDYPEIRSSTFLSIDNNEENIIDLELPFTNTSTMAQRIAKIALFKNRQQITLTGMFSVKALQVQVGDIVNITNSRLGFTNKTFEVQNWTFQPEVSQGLVIQMTLKEISSSVFDWDAEEADFETDNTTLLDPFNVPSVGLNVTSELRVINEKVSQVIIITTTMSTTDASQVDLVEVEFKKSSDTDFKIVGTGELGIYEVFDVEDGQFNVRARAINTLGIKGTYNSTTANIAGQAAPPSNVANFDAIISGDNVILGWDAIPDLDLSFYTIRFSSEVSGATWANSTTDTEKVPRPATTFSVPARSGTYMIRAYDKTSVASPTFTSAVAIPTTTLTQFSNVVTQTESASFSGNKTNLQVTSSALRMTDVSDSSDPILNTGEYIFSQDIDVGSTKLVRAEIIVNTIRLDTSGTVSQWDSIGGGSTLWDQLTGNVDDLSGTTSQQKDSDVQFFIEPSTSGSFTDTYQRFRAGFFTGRYFRFKIQLRSTSTNITPNISTLKAEVRYN